MTAPPGSTIVRTPDHRYALVDTAGEVVAGWYPGVTSILATIARPALVRWIRAETARTAVRELATLATLVGTGTDADAARWLAGTTERIAADAAARGGGVHAIVERLARGEDGGEVSAEAAPYVAAWESWRAAYGPRFAASEAPVLSLAGGYGGTLDAILLDPTGEAWLVDYKTRGRATAEAVYESEPLQVAALAAADLIAEASGAEARPMPAIRRAAIVLLRSDGTWRFCPVRIGEPERSAFAAIGAVHRYLATDARSTGLAPMS